MTKRIVADVFVCFFVFFRVTTTTEGAQSGAAAVSRLGLSTTTSMH